MIVGSEIRKTDHSGAKNGGGGWCVRAVAKAESSRVRRRVDDLLAVSDGVGDYFADASADRQAALSPFQGVSGELPFTER